MEVICMLLMISTVPTFLCQKNEGVCGISGNELTCCPDYYNVKGACITCPKGFFGKGCLTHCPIGRYGVSCKSICSCNSQQTCNSEEGCVENMTKSCNINCETQCTNGLFTSTCKENCSCTKKPGGKTFVERTDITTDVTDKSITNVSTVLINTNTELTTGRDLLVTTQLKLGDRTNLWLYVTLASLASLMLIAVVCSYCYLIKQCYKKKRIRIDLENGQEIQTPATRLELIVQSVVVDNIVYESNCAEIYDSQAACRDSREVSSVYAEPLF